MSEGPESVHSLPGLGDDLLPTWGREIVSRRDWCPKAREEPKGVWGWGGAQRRDQAPEGLSTEELRAQHGILEDPEARGGVQSEKSLKETLRRRLVLKGGQGRPARKAGGAAEPQVRSQNWRK